MELRSRPQLSVLAVPVLVSLLGLGCREQQFNSERTLDAIKSGDRLRATYWSTDGVDAFAFWTDLELATACQFMPYGDGKYRCVPIGAGVYYRDAACTQMVAGRPPCSPATYAVQFGEVLKSGCEPGDEVNPTVRPILGLVEENSTIGYFVDDNGNCQQSNFDTGRNLYAVGDPVDESEFLSATVDLEFPGGRLGLDMLRAEDGSQELLGLRDLERDQVCYAAGGILANVCAPASDAYLIPGQGYFASSSCGGDSLAYSYAECSTPASIEEFVPSACGYSTRYREVGAEVTASVYTDESGMCAPVDQSFGPTRFFEPGDEIPLTSLVPLVQKQTGSGRLRAERSHSESGLLVTVPSLNYTRFRDTQLSAACSVLLLADGSTRCVPDGDNISIAGEGGFFEDAACQSPVYQYLGSGGGCSSAPEFIRTIVSGYDECASNIVGVFRRGSQFSGALYFGDGTDCFEVMPSPEATYYVLGEEIALTSLPSFTLATE